jgi:hypothetical protein
MKFYTKTIFWENVKRTVATFAGPAELSLHQFGAADGWMIASAIFLTLTGMISIWFTDHDNNGIVDFFQ